MSISAAASTAREQARRADGKFGSYSLPDAGTEVDLDGLDFDAQAASRTRQEWLDAREGGSGDDEFAAAYAMADLLEPLRGNDQDIDEALNRWNDGDDEFAAAQSLADLIQTRASGSDADDHERACYRCGTPVDGGTWCDDCSAAETDGPLQPLATTTPDTIEPTFEVPEGMLPIDVTGLEVNRYAPIAAEEFAEHIVDPTSRCVQCPKCHELWGNGMRGECDLCQDEDGLPVEYYANATFLAKTMDYHEWGLQAAPADRLEDKIVTGDDLPFLGVESVGDEYRVQTRYATNHPRVPYLLRTSTSYVEAVGPDGKGGSRLYERAEIAQMRADGVDLRDADIQFATVTEVQYSVFNSVKGARYIDEFSLIHDLNVESVTTHGGTCDDLDEANKGIEFIRDEFNNDVDYDPNTDNEFDIYRFIEEQAL